MVVSLDNVKPGVEAFSAQGEETNSHTDQSVDTSQAFWRSWTHITHETVAQRF